MEPTMIELKQLDLSPQNARKTTSKAAAEEMKASIESHGLMQNLVVTDAGNGRYLVIAGGRRLAALRALQQEGTLAADYAVPCQVVADAQALELSLAENTVRQAMHPADEFEAFARLIDAGQSAEEIAGRFGVTARHVMQRLKLGRVAPKLLKAYRDGALTLDGLMAFAITDDRKKQWKVYQSLAPWQAADAREIRAALTGEIAEADSKLARFVGLDAYHEAGGTSRADLFGESVYLENPDLLNRLAGQKLEQARRQLEAEGWKWVEARSDRDWNAIAACGRIYPQAVEAPPELVEQRSQAQAELAEIERALQDTESDALIDALDAAEATLARIEGQLSAYVAYDPQERQSAGCYVSIGQDGTLCVEKGLVKREDMKRLPKADGRPPKPKGMPEALKRDLEACRLQAAQVEIARHRLVALDLLAFTVARSVFDRSACYPLDMQLRPHRPAIKEPTIAAGELKAIAEGLPLGWLRAKTEAAQFQAFVGLPESDKLDLLAYGVAMSLTPQLATGNEDSAQELALSLTDARLERYWRPGVANYLGRITRDQLLALGRDLLGAPWSQARSRDKKGELAASLARAFAEPETVSTNSERRERLAHWLPEGMAFGIAASPRPAHSKKARKAA